jgi:molybdopterin-guanine dinucleotide biosynthesis protein A
MPSNPSMIPHENIAGVILAGGRSRRMGGGDKSLTPLAGRPLIAHVIGRLRPQVARLAINANGDPARFSSLGLPVIADTVPGFAGPLAGLLAGLHWAEAAGMRFIATAAADTPLFPTDLVQRLAAAAGDAIAIARSGGRSHPVFGLFPVDRAGDLAAFIARGESLRVSDWLAGQAVVAVDFADAAAGGLDPFFNVNTPADLEAAGHALDASPLPES